MQTKHKHKDILDDGDEGAEKGTIHHGMRWDTNDPNGRGILDSSNFLNCKF